MKKSRCFLLFLRGVIGGAFLYSRRLTALSGLRVEAAAGPDGPGLPGFCPESASPPGLFEGFAQGSYKVSLRWRGMAPFGANFISRLRQQGKPYNRLGGHEKLSHEALLCPRLRGKGGAVRHQRGEVSEANRPPQEYKAAPEGRHHNPRAHRARQTSEPSGRRPVNLKNLSPPSEPFEPSEPSRPKDVSNAMYRDSSLRSE